MGHPKVVPCFHSKASCQMVLVLGALDVSQCPDIPTARKSYSSGEPAAMWVDFRHSSAVFGRKRNNGRHLSRSKATAGPEIRNPALSSPQGSYVPQSLRQTNIKACL